MTEIIHVGNQLPAAGDSASTNALIEQFLADAQIRKNSKTSYRKSLKEYFKWIAKNNIELKQVTLTELLRYRADLEASSSQRSGTKLSGFTVGAYLMAVKVFYNWGESKGLMFNPARALKSPKREKKFSRSPITEDQAGRLLDYFETRPIRDFCIVNLMILTGLRTVEVSRANWGDIKDIDGVRVLHVQGKGKDDKELYVKLVDSAFFPIKRYIETRKDITLDSPLFASEGIMSGGTRLIPGTISELVKAGFRAINMDSPSWTAHSLRHTANTTAVDMGSDLKDVQAMSRHASDTTTSEYAKMALARKRLKSVTAENLLEKAFGGRKSQGNAPIQPQKPITPEQTTDTN